MNNEDRGRSVQLPGRDVLTDREARDKMQFEEYGVTGRRERATGYIPTRVRISRESSNKTAVFPGVMDKIRRLLSNKFAVFAVAGIVITSGATIALTKAQGDSYTRNTEEIASLEVPDAIDNGADVLVRVQQNGVAQVVLNDGTIVSEYNGISAEDLARLAGYDGNLADRDASYEQISEGHSR